MREVRVSSYLGLPIPNEDEARIVHTLIDPMAETNFLFNLAHAVRACNPLLGPAIEHDMAEWEKHEIPAGFEEDQTGEFLQGIEEGYDFIIGVFTCIKFLRARESTPQLTLEMFINKPAEQVMPDVGTAIINRIMLVREGSLAIRRSPQETETSSCFADAHSREYLSKASHMHSLITAQTADIQDKVVDSYDAENVPLCLSARRDGFRHGVAQAIEMYIQAIEEDVLRLALG